VLLDIEIQDDGGSGLVLIYAAQDASFNNDDWYPTQPEAERAAEELFGVSEDDWESGPSHS
jgi:hypothetical protein